MVSHKYKCIFVEVPKTGSSSIRRLIGQTYPPHRDICEIRAAMAQHWQGPGVLNRLIALGWPVLPRGMRRRVGARQFDRYYKFGFVRNPWDRMVSLYLRREGMQLRDDMSFEQFIDWAKYSSSTCVFPSPHVNQLDWLVDASGNLLVDFVGRFENLAADWRAIAERIGAPRELPHANRRDDGGQRHYTQWYNDTTRAIVAERFRVDIETFGYTFGAA